MLYNPQWKETIPDLDEVGTLMMRAAALIRTKGLAKGVIKDSMGGYCLYGALGEVTGITEQGCLYPEYPLVREAGRRMLNLSNAPRMRGGTITSVLTKWNDAPERTAEEVAVALEQAAVKW